MPVSKALIFAATALILSIFFYFTHSSDRTQKPLPSAARTEPSPVGMPMFSSDIKPQSLSPAIIEDTRTISSQPETFADFRGYAAVETDDPLRAYGNNLGRALGIFAKEHSDITEVLTRHAQNRTDESAIKALRKLAGDYVSFGSMLLDLHVPGEIKNYHFGLVASYRAIGESLSKIALSDGDAEFLAAVEAHNKRADELAEKLKSLSTIFVLAGVKFEGWEEGRMFTDGERM